MTRGVRVLIGVVVVLAVIYLLFTVVFPWVDRTFITDPVVGAAVNASAYHAPGQ